MPSIETIYEDNDFEDEMEEFQFDEDSLEESEEVLEDNSNEDDSLFLDGTVSDYGDEKEDISSLPVYLNHGTGVALGLWNPAIKVMATVPENYETGNDKCGVFIKTTLVVAALFTTAISGYPIKYVVFEELAIGKVINAYYKGKFSIVSEPPLTLLIYYFISRLTSNYTGNFAFREIGQPYDNEFPYIQLRAFTRVLGLASTYLSFQTLQRLSIKKHFVFLGTMSLILENSFHTQYMYFFSQSILHFFTVSSIYLWKRSYEYNYHDYFSIQWFSNILFTSLSLGCLISSRNFGSSTCIFILFATLYRLWWTLTDTTITLKRVLIAHFVHISLLLFVPLLIFISSWMIHIHLMPNTGPGDYEVSGAFQSSLIGSKHSSVPAQVSYGGFVTIRNKNIHGYLHSHDIFYPENSYQQQVSLYQFTDVNNVWLVEPVSPIVRNDTNEDDPYPVRDGDMIRLLHVPTNRRLHSHQIKSHMSEQDWTHEVSAYGADGYAGDMNDIWVLETSEENTPPTREKWRAVTSVVRFRHALTGCYLFSHRTRLPSWGMDQFEVTCADMGKIPNSLWTVETNFHPGFNNTESVEFVGYPQLNLAEKFLEYSEIIEELNESTSGGTVLQSGLSPYQLPLLPETVKYLLLKELGIQVALFGNLVNWYMAILSITIYILLKIVLIIALQRSWISLPQSQKLIRADHEAGHLVVGWLVHCIRLVGRTTANVDISDYLPSMYFSILFTIVVFNYFFDVCLNAPYKIFNLKNSLLLLWGLTAISGFVFYRPLICGARWDPRACEISDFGNWGFQCFVYTDEFQQTYSRPDNMIKNLFKTLSEDSSRDTGESQSTNIHEDMTKTEFTPRLDIQDSEVREILLNYLSERNFDKDETFLELFPELNDTAREKRSPSSTNQDIESTIKIQWSRVTLPPKINGTLV